MVRSIHEANGYLALIGLIPELHPWFLRLQNLRGNNSGADSFLKNTFDQLAIHREANTKGVKIGSSDSFLSKLLHLEAEDKVGLPHILDSCGSNIGAGSDTTAISLSAALYYLYRHPDKLAKLRDEIDTMADNGLVSDPITFQQAQSMPYLQAVIKETLRVHPAVGTILPRKVPRGGMTLGGTFFPEGVCDLTLILFIFEIIQANASFTDGCWCECLGTPLQQRDLWGRCGCLQSRALAAAKS